MTILICACALLGAFSSLVAALSLGVGPLAAVLSMPIAGSLAAVAAALAAMSRQRGAPPSAPRRVRGANSEPEVLPAAAA